MILVAATRFTGPREAEAGKLLLWNGFVCRARLFIAACSEGSRSSPRDSMR